MTIQRETAKALKATDLIERLKAGGNEPVGSTPERIRRAVSRGYREVREDREGREDSDAGLITAAAGDDPRNTLPLLSRPASGTLSCAFPTAAL